MSLSILIVGEYTERTWGILAWPVKQGTRLESTRMQLPGTRSTWGEEVPQGRHASQDLTLPTTLSSH